MENLSRYLLFGIAFEMRMLLFHLIHLRTPMDMLLFSFGVILKTADSLLRPKGLHYRHDHQLFFSFFKRLLGLFFLIRIFYPINWNKDSLSFPILYYCFDIKHTFCLILIFQVRLHLLHLSALYFTLLFLDVLL